MPKQWETRNALPAVSRVSVLTYPTLISKSKITKRAQAFAFKVIVLCKTQAYGQSEAWLQWNRSLKSPRIPARNSRGSTRTRSTRCTEHLFVQCNVFDR